MGSVHEICLKTLFGAGVGRPSGCSSNARGRDTGEELTWAGLGLDFIVDRGLAENVSSIESCSETSDGY